jgi:outer membrane receptor protein involved in Fe transport
VIAPDSYTAATISGGNPNLKPERADTFTAGIVLSPAPRLRASLDYYNIKIDGAISTLGSGAILDQCLNGNATICSLITREATTNGTSPGRITNIRLAPANVAGINTEGLDFEAAYSFPLANGTFAIRQLATYLMKLDLIGSQGDVTKLAGNMAQVAIDGPSGTSRLRTSTILEFNNDAFRVSATGRFVGGGLVTRDIDSDKPEVPITTPNKINGRFYLDLAGEVTVYRPGGDGRVAVFGAILNAFNKMPPITGYDEYAAPRQLFDVIGRQYTAGVRFNF